MLNFQKYIQYTPDLLTINIVNFFGLVNFLLLTILLLVWSKNTVDLVNYPGLVNFLLLTKKFTKSGVYCNIIRVGHIVFVVSASALHNLFSSLSIIEIHR